MKTVVLGATDNPSRYAYIALHKLLRYGHEVVPVSLKKGEVAGMPILSKDDAVTDVDTVTLYVGTNNLPYWFDYIINLKPRRIIFNPGTENQELENLAREKGIQIQHNRTLVMLSGGSY